MKKEDLLNWCNPVNAIDNTITECFKLINSNLKPNKKLLLIEIEVNKLKNNISKFYEILLAFDSHWSNDYHTAKDSYGDDYLAIRNVLKKREEYYNKLNNKISNLFDSPMPNIFQLYSFLKDSPKNHTTFKRCEYYIEIERKLYVKPANSEMLRDFWKVYHSLSSSKKIDVIRNIFSRYNGLIFALKLINKARAENILESYNNNKYKERVVEHSLIKAVCSNWESIKDELEK